MLTLAFVTAQRFVIGPRPGRRGKSAPGFHVMSCKRVVKHSGWGFRVSRPDHLAHTLTLPFMLSTLRNNHQLAAGS